ncbi:MAG: hypothetical protein ACTSRE_16105 [Promethearchaeota archaeon]
MSEVVEEKNSSESPKKGKERRKNRIRFEWLDQFRGIVIVLFIVQTFAYEFSNDPSSGIAPILPPMVNHGYNFESFSGMPNLITLIDLGQLIFIFLVGFMQAFAVMKRVLKSKEKWRVWVHVCIRVGAIFALAALHILAKFFIDGGPYDFKEAFVNGTLAVIAWSGLAAAVVSILLKKGDHRFWLGFGLMIITTGLWYLTEPHGSIPALITSPPLETFLSVMGLVETAIIATAIAGWIFNPDGTVKDGNWKKRVLPLAFGFMVLSYLSWFIQWADHHHANMSISTMAIGFSAFMIFAFYKMEENGFRLPILTPLGKNLLLVFLLSMVINEVVYMGMILYEFNLIGISEWYGPILDLILAGVVPIMLMWAIVYPLHKYNIIIKI